MADEAPPHKRRKIQGLTTDGPNATQPLTSESSKEDPADSKSRSLFVRSLPADATSETLAAHFSESFPIKHAIVVTDKETKKGKGFGFVTFADADDARRACAEFDGSTLSGRKIRVETAQSRHREEGELPSKVASKPERPAKEDRQPPKLIVRNLPWSIANPDQLANLFRSYGKIKVAVVPKKGGKLSGFGIVAIRGRQNAEKAIAGVNGKEVDGRTLAVDWAVDKATWEKMKEEEVGDDKLPVNNVSDEELDSAASDAEAQSPGFQDDEGPEIEGLEDQEDRDDDDDSDRSEGEAAEDEYEDKNRHTTVFIRNVPFNTVDEDLYDHFRQFGLLRYARVVLDPDTERSRGTAFVCFVNAEDSLACLKNAPRPSNSQSNKLGKDGNITGPSVLQDEAVDPSGKYTLEGRVLSLTQAVSRNDASRLAAEGERSRSIRDKDKRRLYLLSEGTIPSNSALYKQLSPSEIAMREASAKQRKKLIQSNPSLHISLTRLSIRNVPRSLDSKALKALARDAVVGFATDVKEGSRQPLSKEELSRGLEDMRKAEADRKSKGKGVVKQAKVVFETRDGNKVKEADGGRSRGYGFIEYYTHRSALMGLRWLNGHAIGRSSDRSKAPLVSPEDFQDRKRRLIVEFAIENAQVVNRRKERESKSRSYEEASSNRQQRHHARGASDGEKMALDKRKRGPGSAVKSQPPTATSEQTRPAKDDKLAKRNRIIAKKRAMRRARSSAK